MVVRLLKFSEIGRVLRVEVDVLLHPEVFSVGSMLPCNLIALNATGFTFESLPEVTGVSRVDIVVSIGVECKIISLPLLCAS